MLVAVLAALWLQSLLEHAVRARIESAATRHGVVARVGRVRAGWRGPALPGQGRGPPGRASGRRAHAQAAPPGPPFQKKQAPYRVMTGAARTTATRPPA